VRTRKRARERNAVYSHVSHQERTRMTISVQNAVFPKNPPNRETQVPQYLAVQIQIEILLEFECVPRHFEFFDLVDFGGVAFSVETCHISSSDEHFQWKVSYQLIGEIGCVLGCVREIGCVRSLLIVATTYRRDRKVSYQLIGEIGCVFLRYGVGWLRLVGSCKL